MSEYLERLKKIRDLLKETKEFEKVFLSLKVGDKVYLSDLWDKFENIILKIDKNKMRLFVREESIDREQWIDSFYTLKTVKGKEEYTYHILL